MSDLISEAKLDSTITTIDVLQSMFPLPSELSLSPTQLFLLRSCSSTDEPPPPETIALLEDSFTLVLRVDLADEGGRVVEFEISLPLRTTDGDGRPKLRVVHQPWLSHASFDHLTQTLFHSSTSSSSSILISEEDPTSLILQLVEDVRPIALELLPVSTRDSLDNRLDAASLIEQADMSKTRDALLCVSKMHHIVNIPKLRKLKALAISSGASGLVKTGRPGIMLYEIGSKDELAKFLEGVRSLKYLEFHHLTSTPLYRPAQPAVQAPSATYPKHKPSKPKETTVELLAEGKAGLVEVDEMKDVLAAAERVGRREWFREAVGMSSVGNGSKS